MKTRTAGHSSLGISFAGSENTHCNALAMVCLPTPAVALIKTTTILSVWYWFSLRYDNFFESRTGYFMKTAALRAHADKATLARVKAKGGAELGTKVFKG